MIPLFHMFVACMSVGSSTKSSDFETLDTGISEDTAVEENGDDSAENNPADTSDDSDTEDSTDTDTSTDIYACEIPEWGYCLEGFLSQGWIYETASEFCASFGNDNSVATILSSNGCDMSTVIGGCMMPDAYEGITITGWYYDSHWIVEEGQAECAETLGVFVN